MHARRFELQTYLGWLALALMITIIWLLVQGYHGLVGDAQIYAFQAWAKIHPSLSTDLYLENDSQDNYSIFSPFYALIISWFGIEGAARWLTLLFTLWLLCAAARLAATFTSGRMAWLGVAALILLPADYGGSGVFHFSERFLTARLPAEAMIMTAFACHASGKSTLGLIISAAALFVHPLMALPGFLVLICCWLPTRLSLIAGIAGVLSAVGVAIIAAKFPQTARPLAIMDEPWLEVARERSQFLFLQLWSYRDWLLNVRPFAYLIFLAVAIDKQRIRRLCIACGIVGATGIALALTADLVGPVAILVQGQAWRWVWTGCFVSALLTPLLILRVCRQGPWGALCSLLLIAGWVLPAAPGCLSAFLALTIWMLRPAKDWNLDSYVGGVVFLGAIALLAWVANDARGIGSVPIDSIGSVMAAKVVLALLFWAGWWLLHDARKPVILAFATAVLMAIAAAALPMAFRQSRILGASTDINEFVDWTAGMPPTSTVLVAPTRDVGGFVWFTLVRPNYLALDQSAGVVFSRETALEIRRRSEVLQPLTEPTWKVWSGIKLKAAHGDAETPPRPLTANALTDICSDPKLGFVISPENVGFGARTHTHEGVWKNWNLYDCSQVRAKVSI
jgi:hypothetical protein